MNLVSLEESQEETLLEQATTALFEGVCTCGGKVEILVVGGTKSAIEEFGFQPKDHTTVWNLPEGQTSSIGVDLALEGGCIACNASWYIEHYESGDWAA